MPMPLIDKILDECAGKDTTIIPHQMGDPIADNRITGILKKCKDKGLKILMSTSGILLDKAKSEALVDMGVDTINISLDSLNKKIYERIRGVNFDVVMKNVEDLLSVKKSPTAVWISAVDMFFDKLAPDQTVVYLLYDDENIYVAFRCYDSQPNKVIARETKRDVSLWNDDHVSFWIDPFHAHQSQYRSSFKVNAVGTQSSRIAGGRASKTEWKGDWKAAASRTHDGWTGEMAIPFAILSHPSIDGPVTMGINFARRQQRTEIYSFWSNIGPQYHTEKDGHLVGTTFPKRRAQRRLAVMTYAFGGVESDDDTTFRAGLNAKYPITSEMTVVASINPDFSNVAQDVESIDFSYREQYYPDQRPFFQEGGDVIQSESWGFYSRRIPQFDLGLKTYGKIGRMTIGALDCIDFSNASEVDGSGQILSHTFPVCAER